MAPHLVVRDLRKRYGKVEALRGVSFAIRRGEIFGLLGPNGAGKTTTLDCVTGLRDPDDGEIEVGGIDVRRRARAAREKIGVALQSTALPDKITPREALKLFGAFYRERLEPEVLIERFGLAAKAQARFETLSGGERQRLALALAFVNRPEIVLLDEPASGLDPRARRELHAEILRMKADGHTVLLTTHDLDEAEQLCDRIAILHQGRVIATGAPRALTAGVNETQAVTLVTDRTLAAEAFERLPDVEALRIEGTTVTFRTKDARRVVEALMRMLAAAEVLPVDLRVRRATLEEVFLSLTDVRPEAREGQA